MFLQQLFNNDNNENKQQQQKYLTTSQLIWLVYWTEASALYILYTIS